MNTPMAIIILVTFTIGVLYYYECKDIKIAFLKRRAIMNFDEVLKTLFDVIDTTTLKLNIIKNVEPENYEIKKDKELNYLLEKMEKINNMYQSTVSKINNSDPNDPYRFLYRNKLSKVIDEGNVLGNYFNSFMKHFS